MLVLTLQFLWCAPKQCPASYLRFSRIFQNDLGRLPFNLLILPIPNKGCGLIDTLMSNILFPDCPVRLSCTVFLYDSPVRFSCTFVLYGFHVRLSCKIFQITETVAANSHRTCFNYRTTFKYRTYIYFYNKISSKCFLTENLFIFYSIFTFPFFPIIYRFFFQGTWRTAWSPTPWKGPCFHGWENFKFCEFYSLLFETCLFF